MRLNLRGALEGLLRTWKGRGAEDDDGPVSIVLLLREARVSSRERLEFAFAKAFGGPGSGETTEWGVVVQSFVTLIKAGPHILSFLHCSKPYGEERYQEVLDSMSLPGQKRAWSEHTCWEAFDYVKSRGNFDLEYAILAKLCLELVDENCTGAWLPKHGMMIPNDGSLLPYLHRVGASRSIDFK